MARCFSRLIDRHVPKELSVHVVLDNLTDHVGPEVTRWLDHRARARWHLHVIPYSPSWLNLVEQWLNELTARRLRRGIFSSVRELIAAIQVWRDDWKQNPSPFLWHARAEDFIVRCVEAELCWITAHVIRRPLAGGPRRGGRCRRARPAAAVVPHSRVAAVLLWT
jgi:transposase